MTDQDNQTRSLESNRERIHQLHGVIAVLSTHCILRRLNYDKISLYMEL